MQADLRSAHEEGGFGGRPRAVSTPPRRRSDAHVLTTARLPDYGGGMQKGLHIRRIRAD